MATDTIHVFEKAGLGKAPFRVAGVVTEPSVVRRHAGLRDLASEMDAMNGGA